MEYRQQIPRREYVVDPHLRIPGGNGESVGDGMTGSIAVFVSCRFHSSQRPPRHESHLEQPLRANPPGRDRQPVAIPETDSVEVAGNDVGAVSDASDEAANLKSPQHLERPQR
jgi:hypothetical protein